MRTRVLLSSALVLLGVLALQAPAHAKGVAAGVMDGEDGEAIVVTDLNGDLGIHQLLWEPHLARTAAPDGDLGPRLSIRWTLPGPDGEFELLQELHPYADGGPVGHLVGGQRFFDTETTSDRWMRLPESVIPALQARGMPTEDALVPSGSGATRWAPIGGSLLAVVVLGVGLLVFGRKQREVAPAVG